MTTGEMTGEQQQQYGAPVPQQQAPVTEQPTQHAQPTYEKYRQQTGTEEWRADIWDCFAGADNLCLKATFCPCFVHGKIVARQRDPTLTGYERINNDCLMYAGANCICGLGWVLHFLERQKLRETYALKGDTVTDLLLSWCCQCCSLIQSEKEIIARAGPANPAQGYVAPQGMVAGPPQ